jgi:hypothetical protein
MKWVLFDRLKNGFSLKHYDKKYHVEMQSNCLEVCLYSATTIGIA